jgi:YVTN family beta-propeller protein
MKAIVFLTIVGSAIVTLPGCQPAVINNQEQHAGMLIVASKSGNDVYFVDLETGETLAVLPTGLEPHEVEVSDDGKFAVVCNYGKRDNPGNTLTVYDVENLKYVRTIELNEHTYPHGMKWIAGTSRMLVTTEGSQHLLVVDVELGEVVHALYTAEDVSHMVAATPDFRRAFVPSIRTGNMAVFDLETAELISHVYSGAGAEGIDVSPDGKEVWVTNRADNTISVFDTETLDLIASIPCADFPIRAKFTPDGRYFVVSNARSGDIAVFNAAERSLKGRVKMTPPPASADDDSRYFAEFEGTSIPIGIVIPNDSTVYVANTRSDAVTEINLNKMEISRHIAVGKEPDGIHFSSLKPIGH